MERGIQFARRPDIRVTGERMRDLVRVFLMHTLERECRQTAPPPRVD